MKYPCAECLFTLVQLWRDILLTWKTAILYDWILCDLWKKLGWVIWSIDPSLLFWSLYGRAQCAQKEPMHYRCHTMIRGLEFDLIWCSCTWLAAYCINTDTFLFASGKISQAVKFVHFVQIIFFGHQCKYHFQSILLWKNNIVFLALSISLKHQCEVKPTSTAVLGKWG